MTIKEHICDLIPDCAKLEKFSIVNNIHVKFFWDAKSDKNLIGFLNETVFILHKYKCKIRILKGFTCDGGSTPRFSWSTTSDPYSTICLLGFILHDALYCTQYFTRAECDWILLEFLKELGVSWFTRNKIWFGVKAGGYLCAWRKHTKQTIETSRQYVLKEDIENA